MKKISLFLLVLFVGCTSKTQNGNPNPEKERVTDSLQQSKPSDGTAVATDSLLGEELPKKR